MEPTTAQKREAAKDLLADVFASMAAEDAGPVERRRVGLELLDEALDIAKLDPECVEDLEPQKARTHEEALEAAFKAAIGPPLDQRSRQMKRITEQLAGYEPVLSSVPGEALWNELERRGVPFALKGQFQIVTPDGTQPDGRRILATTVLAPSEGWARQGLYEHKQAMGERLAIHGIKDGEASADVAGYTPEHRRARGKVEEARDTLIEALGLYLDAGETDVCLQRTAEQVAIDALAVMGLDPPWKPTGEDESPSWCEELREAIDGPSITDTKRKLAIAVLDGHLSNERALSIINVLRQ